MCAHLLWPLLSHRHVSLVSLRLTLGHIQINNHLDATRVFIHCDRTIFHITLVFYSCDISSSNRQKCLCQVANQLPIYPSVIQGPQFYCFYLMETKNLHRSHEKIMVASISHCFCSIVSATSQSTEYCTSQLNVDWQFHLLFTLYFNKFL